MMKRWGRRQTLLGALGLSADMFPISLAEAEQTKPVFVNIVTSLENAYYVRWNDGGQSVAKQLVADYVVIETQGKADKLRNSLQEAINSYGQRAVYNVDLASRFQAKDVVEALFAAKCYFVTHSYEPAVIKPWAFDPYYVCHMISDHRSAGSRMASLLMRKTGSKGQFVALGGPNNDGPARLRKDGLMRVMQSNRQVSLLEFRAADWEASVAFEITKSWLAQHKEKISGIWAANDRMAVGAIEALRVYRMAGRIPVTGIDGYPDLVDAIRTGELLGTVPWDPYADSAAGLWFAHAARSGLVDPSTQPDSRREFMKPVLSLTQDNLDQWVDYVNDRHAPIQAGDRWAWGGMAPRISSQ